MTDHDDNDNETFDPTFGAGADAAVDPEYAEHGLATEQSGPPKSALTLLAGIIIIGGGGLFVMHKKAGPSAAMASPEITKAASDIDDWTKNGDTNLERMRSMLKSTEQVVDKFEHYSAVNQVSLEQLKTNPFEAQKPKVVVDDTAEKERLAALAKEKEAIKTAAGQLQLQMILWSETDAKCIISGRPYGLNAQVNGFTIEKLEPSAVTVRNGEYVFRLSLQPR